MRVNVTGIMEWWYVGRMGDQIDLMFVLFNPMFQYSIIPYTITTILIVRNIRVSKFVIGLNK